jgi:hypothetical protein
MGQSHPPLSLHSIIRLYEVRPRADKRGVDLISDALPFGRLWYGELDAISNAVGYAKFFSCSHDAVIRVYDEAGKVIETHEHAGDFKESGVKRIAFLIRSNCNNHKRTDTKDSTSKDKSCSTRTRKEYPSSNMGTNPSRRDNQIRTYTKGNTHKNNSRS